MPNATVLVVDDIPANLSLLLDALSQAAYRVLVAESGEGALAQVDHEVPDLILLDFMLPGINGLEVCRRLKLRPALADVPIIFLTAVDDVGEKVRALEAGAVDYVTKPIQTAEVLARVRTQLRLAALQRALQDEVDMRREAEELLRDSLDRGLLLVDAQGRIHFATQLTQTLLTRFFPNDSRDRLPAALLQMAGSGMAADLPAGLEVRVVRAIGPQDLGVLELSSERTPKPADLLSLGLTPREAEVLFWISEGKTNAEIAIILGSSRRTVEKHAEHVLEKLNVENRAGAVRVALETLRTGG